MLVEETCICCSVWYYHCPLHHILLEIKMYMLMVGAYKWRIITIIIPSPHFHCLYLHLTMSIVLHGGCSLLNRAPLKVLSLTAQYLSYLFSSHLIWTNSGIQSMCIYTICVTVTHLFRISEIGKVLYFLICNLRTLVEKKNGCSTTTAMTYCELVPLF